MTAPPLRYSITPLQRWLDDHDMTPTSLAVELAIPKETTLALASGSTERISLKYLQAIQNYTQIDYHHIVSSEQFAPSGELRLVADPSLSGDERIDTMLDVIGAHLQRNDENAMAPYIADDFTCSGESYQLAHVTQRCLTFDQMVKSNSNNDDSITNHLIAATWINLDGCPVEQCTLLSTSWMNVGVDPHGTVTKNYTTLFLDLRKPTAELADDELPQIRRWWWRVPTEFGQPT